MNARKPYTLYQVDAFTHQVFGGNSAAVVPLSQWLPDPLLQAIALENNLSETVFFVPVGADHYHIRWFTPEVEVDLCGHATLAAAHILFTELADQLSALCQRIVFDSLSGELAVSKQEQHLTLDFPERMPEPMTDPTFKKQLEDALGTSILSLHQSRDIMAVLNDEGSVRTVQPDFAQLAALKQFGFIVTAQGSDQDVDFVSRFFAPSQGINEDPVTGSAHCSLAPYWAKQLNKSDLKALQVSQRLGHLHCKVSEQRVLIGGQCVTYLNGTIYV